MEQTTDNIKKYLEQASKLESSVYEQKKSCEYAKSLIVKPVYSLPNPPAPERKEETAPKKPTPDNPHKGLDYFFIAMAALGVILLIVGIAVLEDLLLIGACFAGFNLCLFLLHRIVFVKTIEKQNAEAEESYRKAMNYHKEKNGGISKRIRSRNGRIPRKKRESAKRI